MSNKNLSDFDKSFNSYHKWVLVASGVSIVSAFSLGAGLLYVLGAYLQVF